MNAPPTPASPWNPAEKTELLCEIVKASGPHPDRLLSLVRSLPPPNWDDLVIPRGRTLNQCKSMYNDYVQSSIHPPPQQLPYHDPARPLDFRRSVMREPPPQIPPPTVVPPPGSAISSGPRYPEIQPRPPAHGGPPASPPPQPERRKRGRPTKVEAERRRLQERQRDAFFSPTREQVLGPPIPGPSLVATQAAQAVMNPSLQLLPKGPVVPVESPRVKRKRSRSFEADGLVRHGPEGLDPPGPAMKPVPGPQPPSRGYPDILQREDNHGAGFYRGSR